MSSKINMDLSKFRHVHSNDNHTQLMHQDGHMLTLSHASLNKDQQAQLKALAKSAEQPIDQQEAKAENPPKMADGGKVADKRVVGIRSESAANGVKGANSVRDRGQDTPHGMTINIQKPEPKTYGKIMDPKGNKPQVYADGGNVKMYADGTKGDDGAQANDSAPAEDSGVVSGLKHAWSRLTGEEPVYKNQNPGANVGVAPSGAPIDISLPQPQDPTTVDTGVPTPADRFAYLKAQANAPMSVDKFIDDVSNPRNPVQQIVSPMTGGVSDKELTQQVADEQSATQAAAESRKNEETQQQLSALDTAQQKQKMGIPLSPADQAAIDQAASNQPSAMESMAQATPTGQMPTGGLPGDGSAKKEPWSDTAANMRAGYNKQVQGLTGEANNINIRGINEAKAIEHNVGEQQKAIDAYKVHYEALEQERQKFMGDIRNGYINPDKYWTGYTLPNGEKVGGHSKISAGIGMVLSGFNPTSQPNAATNFLRYQMDQSIQAQARNLGASESLLSHNLLQFGHLKDAVAMTSIMQNQMLEHQMTQAASMAAGPIAQERAKQAIGVLQMDTAQKMRSLSMSQALMKFMSGPPGQNDGAIQQGIGLARVMGMPDVAKNLEEKWIPGVGVGKIPAPEAVRQQILSGQELQNTAQDVLNYSKTHTNLNPMSPEYKVGVQKSMILQQKIREGLLGTVFRESEKPLLQKFVDDNPAGAFKTLSSDPKIKTILDANQMQLNQIKSNYGLPTTHTSYLQSTHPMEGKIAVGPGGQRLQMNNGKWTPVK